MTHGTKNAVWDDTGQILILSFDFDHTLKNQVKALGARFDWTTKTWRFYGTKGLAVIPQLIGLGFPQPPGSTDSSGPPVAPTPAPVPRATQAIPPQRAGLKVTRSAPQTQRSPTTWSVSQINMRAAGAITSLFPHRIWVVGKVAGARRLQAGRHAYFDLIEEDATGQPIARLPSVLFQLRRAQVECQLTRRGIQLEDGLQVRFHGRVELYTVRGNLSFIIEDIDASYSEGALAIKREEVLRELREAGLSRRNLELPTPLVPLRIALLTSNGSDAYHDVMDTLRDKRRSRC